jgi:hypothetical protein
LVAHFTFGQLRRYRNTVGIPLVVTIHNLSRYIHEKNLAYRLIVGNSDVVRVDAQQIPTILHRQASIEQSCRPVFHYNASYYNEYLLINQRGIGVSQPIDIDILFSFWGELSPVKINRYRLALTGSINDQYQYQVVESSENVYSYEHSDNMNVSDDQRNALGRNQILQSLENRLPETMVHLLLNDINNR